MPARPPDPAASRPPFATRAVADAAPSLSSVASDGLAGSVRTRWLAIAAVPLLAWGVGIAAHPTGARDSDGPPADTGPSSSADAVTTVAPTLGTSVDARFGEGIRLRRVECPQTPVARGDTFVCRFVFESTADVERDWQIFVHTDARVGGYRIHGDHFPAGGDYDTTLWKPGEFIVDRLEQRVPADATPGAYDVWLGFYIDGERLPVRADGPGAAFHDGDNRVRAASLTVR